MKKIILTLVILISFQWLPAQEFVKTKEYQIVEKNKVKESEYTPHVFQLVSTAPDGPAIATYEVTFNDTFEEIEISVLDNPELEGVDRVIKVDLIYAACCTSEETYYYLAKDNGDFIGLPKVENVYCGSEATLQSYIFPNQTFGIEGAVLKKKVAYTSAKEIKKIETIQQIVWNDSDFSFPRDIVYTKY